MIRKTLLSAVCAAAAMCASTALADNHHNTAGTPAAGEFYQTREGYVGASPGPGVIGYIYPNRHAAVVAAHGTVGDLMAGKSKQPTGTVSLRKLPDDGHLGFFASLLHWFRGAR